MSFHSLGYPNVQFREAADRGYDVNIAKQLRSVPGPSTPFQLRAGAPTGIFAATALVFSLNAEPASCSTNPIDRLASQSGSRRTVHEHRAIVRPQTCRPSAIGGLHAADDRPFWFSEAPAGAALNPEARRVSSAPSDHPTMTPPILVAPTGDNPC